MTANIGQLYVNLSTDRAVPEWTNVCGGGTVDLPAQNVTVRAAGSGRSAATLVGGLDALYTTDTSTYVDVNQGTNGFYVGANFSATGFGLWAKPAGATVTNVQFVAYGEVLSGGGSVPAASVSTGYTQPHPTTWPYVILNWPGPTWSYSNLSGYGNAPSEESSGTVNRIRFGYDWVVSGDTTPNDGTVGIQCEVTPDYSYPATPDPSAVLRIYYLAVRVSYTGGGLGNFNTSASTSPDWHQIHYDPNLVGSGAPITQTNMTYSSAALMPNAPYAQDDTDPATWVEYFSASDATQSGFGVDLAGTYTAPGIGVVWETLGADCQLEWYMYLNASTVGPYAEIGAVGGAWIDLVAQPSGSTTFTAANVLWDPSGYFGGGFDPALFLARVQNGDVHLTVTRQGNTAGFKLLRFQVMAQGPGWLPFYANISTTATPEWWTCCSHAP